MSESLNFTTINKQYLNVTLADENNTTISVCMPTKALLRELTAIKIEINEAEDKFEALDVLYDVCAKTMSRNRDGVAITREFLEEIFDFEDIVIFLKKYMDFVTKVAGRKN